MADKTSSIVWSPSSTGWNGRDRMGVVELASGDTIDLVSSSGQSWGLEFLGASGDLSGSHRQVASPYLESAWTGVSPNLLLVGPNYVSIPLIPISNAIGLRITNQAGVANKVSFSIKNLTSA